MEQLGACFFVFGGEEESEEKNFWRPGTIKASKTTTRTRIKVVAVKGRK
jgi:hypothetical protein